MLGSLFSFLLTNASMAICRLTAGRLLVAILLFSPALAERSTATVVRFDTNLGDVDVRLYDTATPLSIANFLSYVNTDRWDGTFIHRSVPGFIVQGGGFSLTPDIFNTTDVVTDPPVLNEPGISNLRGTIAYAKIGGNPDSATSQWFFNLADNSSNLDNQNSGFTVFGRVVGGGMDVVDSIAALSKVSAGGPFTDVPVTDYDQVIAQQNIFNSEAVLINDVFVLGTPDGDYDFDGDVDADDYLIWQRGFGSTTDVTADNNGDAIVDADDLTPWINNFGTVLASTATISAVPEPSTLTLLGLAALIALRQARRANRQGPASTAL